MKTIIKLLAGLTVFFGLTSVAMADTKAVYHVNDSANAVAAMRNAGNHLDADPKAKIVFVTHSKGIDFLIEGAVDKDGNPYNINIEKLLGRGVEFRVCNNTLVSRKIDPKTMVQGSKIVPSGVAEVARLQAAEGFAYVKP